ncbi:DUF6188 family protein [Streptomyces sp. NPDC004783]|uniref:DUF6188 family protein n=1 Tax=Streptomyces sp. NPDC004783 TaxID=3154459 RepID=UPI0033ACB7F9
MRGVTPRCPARVRPECEAAGRHPAASCRRDISRSTVRNCPRTVFTDRLGRPARHPGRRPRRPRLAGGEPDAAGTCPSGPGGDVVLETPARLSSGPAHSDPGVLLVPETQDLAAALPLFGTKVVSAVAFKSGTLRMVFQDGTHLTCPTDAAFEARQITGPGGWRFDEEQRGGLTGLLLRPSGSPPARSGPRRKPATR